MSSFSTAAPLVPSGTSNDLSVSIFPHVIAVTGTIGSGKSSVIEIFKNNGAYVLSADELSREIVAPRSAALGQIATTFGERFISADGTLNRKLLGEHIFKDPSDLTLKKKLEGILFPLIEALAAEKFKVAFAAGHQLLVYEVPLLFEAGLQHRGFKSIIVVSANDEVCLERAMARDGATRETALKRLQTQMPTAQKVAGANFVIDNSGDKDSLRNSVASVLEQLVKL